MTSDEDDSLQCLVSNWIDKIIFIRLCNWKEKRCTADKKDGKYEKDFRTWDVNNSKILTCI